MKNDGKLLADRILVRIMLPRERLADDGDELRVCKESVSLTSRPCRIGVPTVSKNPGVTKRRLALFWLARSAIQTSALRVGHRRQNRPDAPAHGHRQKAGERGALHARERADRSRTCCRTAARVRVGPYFGPRQVVLMVRTSSALKPGSRSAPATRPEHRPARTSNTTDAPISATTRTSATARCRGPYRRAAPSLSPAVPA